MGWKLTANSLHIKNDIFPGFEYSCRHGSCLYVKLWPAGPDTAGCSFRLRQANTGIRYRLTSFCSMHYNELTVMSIGATRWRKTTNSLWKVYVYYLTSSILHPSNTESAHQSNSEPNFIPWAKCLTPGIDVFCSFYASVATILIKDQWDHV